MIVDMQSKPLKDRSQVGMSIIIDSREKILSNKMIPPTFGGKRDILLHYSVILRIVSNNGDTFDKDSSILRECFCLVKRTV